MPGYRFDPELFRVSVVIAGAGLAALFFAWLLLRPFNCWYWKVNERLGLLKEIRDLLVRSERRAEEEAAARAEEARRPKETLCRQCGSRYPGELTGQFCEQCGARL